MGKKRIVGEDGKTYFVKEKKPIYKKVWFWLLVIIVIAIIGGSLGGDEEPEAAKVNTESTSNQSISESDDVEDIVQESTSEVAEEFHIGDTVSVDGYEITVNTVDYSDGEGFSTPDEGKQFVIMNITITNNTDEKESFNPLDFSLNVDGVSSTTGFSYVDGVDTLNSGDLDPGASVTGNLIGEAPEDASLKLRYEGNMFLKNHEVDIILR